MKPEHEVAYEEACLWWADHCEKHDFIPDTPSRKLSEVVVGDDGVPVVTLRNVNGKLAKVRLGPKVVERLYKEKK